METLLGALIGLAVMILIFWACREIVCWYWKINERLELQRETVRLLKKINNTGIHIQNQLNKSAVKDEQASELENTTEA
ncbi:MAG: hypothetical protein ACNI27_13570 [Desulfovibrio sp.]